jgi:superfamily II DNA or RNA helicase
LRAKVFAYIFLEIAGIRSLVRIYISIGEPNMKNLLEGMTGLVARGWQEAFIEKLMAKDNDFLLVATPGAGKTIAALLAAMRKQAKFLVIVVPKDGLCTQWSAAAAEFGINLCANRDPGRDFERLGYDGIVTTYQALAANPLAYRSLADRSGVMSVFDECHHMSDSKSWGSSASHALGQSDFILSLSGTPYRSDNDPIPFIRYDEERVCVPDFSYGYDFAVRDRVCRPVMFFSRDGDVNFRRWYRSSEFTKLSSTSKLTKTQQDQWYTVATQDVNGFIRDMFIDADARLTELREQYDYPYGGIVMCRDQKIAREVVDLIKMETGETPSLVISEDGEDAKKERDAFTNGHGKWLVAVEMVSEGIDIPRLATMVYAGSAKTQLRWDQAIGRIVRMIKDNPSDSLICAACYFPAHKELLRFAEEMEKLAVHRLKDIEEKKPREPGESTGPREDDLEIKDGASYPGRTISHDGLEIPEAALNLAKAEIKQTGARRDPL